MLIVIPSKDDLIRWFLLLLARPPHDILAKGCPEGLVPVLSVVVAYYKEKTACINRKQIATNVFFFVLPFWSAGGYGGVAC